MGAEALGGSTVGDEPRKLIAIRSDAVSGRRKHDGIAAGDPLQTGDAAAEISLNRRQRHIHDRRIDNDHEETDARYDYRHRTGAYGGPVEDAVALLTCI